MKKLFLSALLLCSLAAHADLNTSVLLTSDYVLRGVSLSDGKPSIQLGLEGESAYGLYGGGWLSSVRLAGPDSPSSELFAYAGWGVPLSEDWVAAVEAARMFYLGTEIPEHYDYSDYSVLLNYQNYGVRVSFTDDVNAIGGHAMHYQLNGQWPLSEKLALRGVVAHYQLKEASQILGLPDDHYQYLRVGMDYNLDQLTLSIDAYKNSKHVENMVDDIGKSRIAFTAMYTF